MRLGGLKCRALEYDPHALLLGVDADSLVHMRGDQVAGCEVLRTTTGMHW